MNYFKSFFILFFLFSCKTTTLISNDQPFELKKNIERIAKRIASVNEIHSKAINYNGEKTIQYKNFEKLVEQASIDELLELSNHNNPTVRGYSFWALAKRHYENLEDVFISHANDEVFVYTIQGCIGGDIPLIDFMCWVVMPNLLDLECKKLDDSSFEAMREKQL